MLGRRRGLQAAAAFAVIALAASGCGGSNGGGGSSGGGSSPGQNTNDKGSPQTGGTLHMLGTGDVDYMDPNISYYSIGYLALRIWSRQLVTYPAVPGKTTQVVPDIATEIPTVKNGGVSKDGLTYKFTIKKNVKWDTSPARQVTADDIIRGVKRTCNPAQPFGGLPDYQTLIAGFDQFCQGFAKVDPKDPKAIADYQTSHDVEGLSVDPSNNLTVVFKLTQPASYFTSMVSMPAFSPAPVEYNQYLPASADLAQHTISDGPYKITSYNPAHEIKFDRNPAWDSKTDDVRKAYVDAIDINQTGNQDTIQQQLKANAANADMEFDSFPPVSAVPGLISSKDPNFVLGPQAASNPYIVFNTLSPNNGGATGKVAVRQAISEAINRSHLIQDANGSQVSPPLTHVLPAGISGTKSNTSPDLYPYDAAKAKKDLASAGYSSGIELKVLYRPKSSLSSKIFTTLQQDLSQAGIKVTGVPSPNADFYTKYLEVPDVAKKGTWDAAIAGWGADWYGDAALSFFGPLFSGEPSFPPNGSNFGFYNSSKVNDLIKKASAEQDPSKSADLWAQADKQVMEDAAFYPITAPNQPVYHASHVHHTVFIPAIQNFDPTNVWLSK